jgi:hypothetical protein
VLSSSLWRELHTTIAASQTPQPLWGPTQKESYTMSFTPEIETSEIPDADLDNISGGVSVRARCDGREPAFEDIPAQVGRPPEPVR